MTPFADLEAFSDFASELAAAAAAETLPRFRQGTAVDNKWATGFDPVTQADREAERAIREVLENRFPDHGIVGEEHGRVRTDARFQWIIDPIDGTRAFISGLPTWGTLVGLYNHGVPVAGVMDQPFTGERWCALAGHGARATDRFGDTGIATSSVTSLADATTMTTMPQLMDNDADRAWLAVEAKSKLQRYGADCYAFAMLAAGHVDVVAETGVQSYDVAALIPIVREAGGVFTTWEGGDPSQGGRVVACANAGLHKIVLSCLQAG
ncbi:histidinol-phosphatase [Rhizobiaceae bacterium]|nr:histidinol-phosphatase [Rhizobiaceae bacterium]